MRRQTVSYRLSSVVCVFVGACVLVAALVTGCASSTPTGELVCPVLLSPKAGAVLDNGRTDGEDFIVWTFTWSACPGADAYQLYVIGPSAIYPLVNDVTAETNYTMASGGYIVEANAVGWTWKVRARVEGAWGTWTRERSFNVEPVNTDPPLSSSW